MPVRPRVDIGEDRCLLRGPSLDRKRRRGFVDVFMVGKNRGECRNMIAGWLIWIAVNIDCALHFFKRISYNARALIPDVVLAVPLLRGV